MKLFQGTAGGRGVLAVCLALALTACGAPGLREEEPDGDARDQIDWEKGHYYEVLDGNGELLYTIGSGAGVKAVDELLEEALDGWDESGEPGETLYTYVFWQEATLTLGEDPDAERPYEALIRISVPAKGTTLTIQVTVPEEAEPDFIDLEELLTFQAEASGESAEALRNPAQFAE